MTVEFEKWWRCGRLKDRNHNCWEEEKKASGNHACGGPWSFGEVVDVKPGVNYVCIDGKYIELDTLSFQLEEQRKAEDPMEGMEGSKHEIYRTAKALAEAVKDCNSSQVLEFQTILLELFRLRKKRKKAKRKQLRDAVVKAACDLVDRSRKSGSEMLGPIFDAVDDYRKSIVKGYKDATLESDCVQGQAR